MQIIINWVVQKQIANDTCWQMARLQVSSSIPLVDKEEGKFQTGRQHQVSFSWNSMELNEKITEP